jgi:hypothetical protein
MPASTTRNEKALNNDHETHEKSAIHERELIYKILFRVFRVFRVQKCLRFSLFLVNCPCLQAQPGMKKP